MAEGQRISGELVPPACAAEAATTRRRPDSPEKSPLLCELCAWGESKHFYALVSSTSKAVIHW